MDGDTLSMTADCLAAASGSCLTAEQRAMLPSSLAILKNEHAFSKVFYWGRLQGIQGDYLIAQGLGQAIGDRKEAAIRTGGDLTVAEFFNNLNDIPKQFFRLGFLPTHTTTSPYAPPTLPAHISDRGAPLTAGRTG